MARRSERSDAPATDDVAPSYPPTRLVIDVPFEGEPKVIDMGGLASYLVETILLRCAQQHTTVWEVETADDE